MNHTAFFEQVKKGNIQPVYLMEGTEEYIKQQALKNLCARLLPEGLEQMNLTDLTDPAPDALIAAAETLPFLAEKRVVVVRECTLLTAGRKSEDEDRAAAMEKLAKIEALEQQLPGLHCGSCGAPSCRAFAEDVVLGRASEEDCIFKMRERMQYMTGSSDADEYLPAPFRHKKELPHKK